MSSEIEHTRQILELLKINFKSRFHVDPVVISFAPGRVEVLGNHTDYNEGFVLSAAIDSGTFFLLSPTSNDDVTIVSHNEVVWNNVRTSPLQPTMEKASWSNYIKGVLAQLLELKPDMPHVGFNAVFGGDLALGAGLSSSAALEVSSAIALSRLYKLEEKINPLQLAKICQKSEHVYVGLKCGLLDQFSSLFGKANHLVMSDFRTLEVQTVPLGDDACFLICNTHVHHNLVASEYNVRRESCEKAVKFFAQKLNHPVTHLRDVSWAEWKEFSSGMENQVDAKRAAHPIGEDERVIQGRDLLTKQDRSHALQQFGQLMYESHESSRIYFENSCPELDEVVEEAKKTGKVYGGGFGGSAVILVHKDNVQYVKSRMEQKFPKYHITIVRPSSGAQVM